MHHTPCCLTEIRLQCFGYVPRAGSITMCPFCDTLLTIDEELRFQFPTDELVAKYNTPDYNLVRLVGFGIRIGGNRENATVH